MKNSPGKKLEPKTSKSTRPEKAAAAKRPADSKEKSNAPRDDIEEASMESFPASDAPSSHRSETSES